MKKEYPDILKLEGEKWHNPDPATGKLGTRVPAEWLQTTEDSLKSLTLEMLEVLKAAGINPNELNNTQVRDAIQKMILARVINYNDIVGRPIVKDSLGDDRNNPASQRVVNDVNRAANNAQTSANIANEKANQAQVTADKKRNLNDFVFKSPASDSGVLLSAVSGVGDALSLHVRSSNQIEEKFSLVMTVGDGDRRYLHLPYKSGRLATLGDIPKADVIPASQVFIFRTKVPPAGYVVINGAAINKETSPKLFAEFGTHLPQDIDRFYRNAGTRSGISGTYKNDAIRNITGEIGWRKGVEGIRTGVGAFSGGPNGVSISSSGHASGITTDGGDYKFSAANVVPTDIENVPYSVAVLFCLKIQ